MELSISNIKKVFLILWVGKQLRNYLLFLEMETLSNFPILKNKKIHPEKNSLYFGKWNFIALALKNFLYFLKRKLFRKKKPRKNSMYLKKQNFLIFQEMESLKSFLYFRKELAKHQKQTKILL